MAKAEKMKVEGAVDRAKGKARSTYGKITGNKEQRAKGALDQAKGRAKQAAGRGLSKER